MTTSKSPSFYVDPQRMKDCTYSGNVIRAKVIGNATYRVKIEIDKKKHSFGYCTCPAFRNNANCKHIVAVSIAFQKHPEWFKKIKTTENKLKNISHEKSVEILGLLSDIVPEANKIIECELEEPQKRIELYSKYVRDVINTALNNPEDDVSEELEIFQHIAEYSFKNKQYFTCLKICYEIVYGCLKVDNEFGSTEIFPSCFVSETWELYMEALRKIRCTKNEKNEMLEQLNKLNSFESYLFDQEGVYPQEGIDYLQE